MRIVTISDTHGHHETIDLPDGDILIHAGDFSQYGNFTDIHKFSEWLNQLHSFEEIIVIAGNHDMSLAHGNSSRFDAIKAIEKNAIYLEDDCQQIDNFKIYGTPWTPIFNNWAFMKSESKLSDIFTRIPDDTDILITHGPPAGKLDECPIPTNPAKTHSAGSNALSEAVKRVNPDIHIFGHIHESYGQMQKHDTEFCNCSIVNGDYTPIHDPMVINL